MLKFNSFRAQRYLRSRFIEGKYLLASEASDIELEIIDTLRKLVHSTFGDMAVDRAWKCDLFRIQTAVTSKAVNVLGVDTSLLDLANIGDKVFKNGEFVTEITNVNVGGGTITVTSAASINISDNIEILTTTSLLLSPGEAWFDGLPFIMRDGQDQLVSGSTLAAGILSVPGGGPSSITMQDDPNGRGKIVTFSDGGITPTAQYQVVISAREQVITNSDDPFIKNVNIPESTAQKLRLTYRINVVVTDDQTDKPIPYTDTTIDGNLTNFISVIPQTGGNGSEISRTVVSGSEAIDGRNLEITVRNNPTAPNPLYAGSPVGNPIPTGSSQQQEYSNGLFIDSLGQQYWLNAIFNDVVANQVILRIDKEVTQTDPVIIIGQPYKLVKRDVYVTDDNAGSPLGQLFWPIANVEWNSTDGFVHDSKVEDLRNEIESIAEHEEKTTVKFNLRLLGGGTVTAEPTVKATASVEVIDNTFAAGDAIIIRGVSFEYNVDWVAGVDVAATAANIVSAIAASTNPLIANQVIATDAGAGLIDLEAAVGGTAGNAYTLAEVDTGNDNFTLSGPLFTGGVDATPGELTWDEDFKIINPNGATQLVLAGRAVLREGGAAAFMMDLENGGVISRGEEAVTTTTNGTSISFAGSPDLSQVRVGNTIVVDQEVTSITEVDDVNKTVQVFPALVNIGAGYISLDSFASGTAPLDSDIFVLAVKTGDIIQVTGRGELEQGESTTSGVPIQLLQYIGSPSETDNSPLYSNVYGINQGDSLTTAIGKLDLVAENSDAYTGKTSPSDTAPAYSSNNYVTDGNDLTTAIGDLDTAVDGVQDDVNALETYAGSPGGGDTTPDYSSNYAITDGDDLTVAAGKLDAAQAASDDYTGKPSALDTTPDYSSNYGITDGDDLTVAAGKLDAVDQATDTYVGKPGPLDTTPDYSSNNFITDSDSLTDAIGDLDAALGVVDTDLDALYAQEIQDRNAKLTKGGTWSWNQTTGVLSWSAAAFIQIPNLADSVNEISIGTATLASDGQVAYVQINRAGPGGILTVSVAANASLVPGNNTFVIARRTGTDVLVGRSFLLKDREYLEMDGALAEINRRLNQLRLTAHETSLLKARIATADITQLDSAILTQELSDFVLNFSGAVINFTTGAVLASDDATPLGINFTPFSVPVGQYFWYGIGLIPASVDGSNRMTAQVQVTPASAANAVAASAPFPNILGDKKLGAIQVFNNAGTIQVFLVRRLGVGSGSGSGGTGDTTEVLETIKNTLDDSIYTLAAHTVFKVDEDSLVDPTSTGDFSLVSKTYELATAELMLSLSLLDQEEFLDLGKDLTEVDVSVFWAEGMEDDAATVEVSRDGGSHWSEVTMERVGLSTYTFHGTYEFEEEQDAVTDQFTTTTNTFELTNLAGTREALAQRVVVSAEREVPAFGLYLSKGSGAPDGNYRISLYTDNAGVPNLAGLIKVGDWTLANGLTTSAVFQSITLDETLQPATYWIVVETDNTYKTGFTAGVKSVRAHGVTAGGDGSAFDLNGVTWTTIASAKLAYQLNGFTESFAVISSHLTDNAAKNLNTTTQQKLAQLFTLVDTNVLKRVKLNMVKTGSPTGFLYASLVRDNAGSPSTDINDILCGPVPVSVVNDIPAGTNVVTIDIPTTAVPAGTYHIVVETDAAYKATFSNGVTQISLRSDTAGSGANAYNGTVWASSTGGLYYSVDGRSLDLLLRVTASQTSALDGFAVFYDAEAGVVITSTKNLERQTFNALTPIDEFTVSAFMPDPDLLVVYWEETGQAFVSGAFQVDGQVIRFPEDTFALGFDQAVTLRFDQTRGGGFDNSDRNANLLAANHLGSSDPAFDRSTPGRGWLLRSADGTLYEVTVQNGGAGFDIYEVT